METLLEYEDFLNEKRYMDAMNLVGDKFEKLDKEFQWIKENSTDQKWVTAAKAMSKQLSKVESELSKYDRKLGAIEWKSKKDKD